MVTFPIMTTWTVLHQSMEQRWRPEDVAALATELVPDIAPILAPARGFAGRTVRVQGFRGHSIDTSITSLFPGLPEDPVAAVEQLRQDTGLTTGDLRHRMPSVLRKETTTLSRRQYMKRCRILVALERKLERRTERGRFVRWTRIAQSGWSVDITLPDFMAMTQATRVFVAYYVARRQRQSVFSGSGQDPAMDEVANRLLRFVVATSSVALACSSHGILSELSERQRTLMLIKGYREMLDMAVTMRDLWRETGADPFTMVVKRGMNSSDWNAIAGAWNAVRAMWLNLLFSLGREEDLDVMCPGKAMRLMAADVAAWHRSLGDDEGPDVKLFRRLPLPWDVALGTAKCTQIDVRAAAIEAGVQPDGWVRPKEAVEPVKTKPTMDLVHGVAVADPDLANMLRRAGWFSGKPVKSCVPASVRVTRDELGFALGAERSSAIERSALTDRTPVQIRPLGARQRWPVAQ